MAEEEKPDKKPEEDVSKNPDLEKETEGMVDLSDVLATGDNQTGAADASEALKQVDEDAPKEVDLFAKNEGDATAEETPQELGKIGKLIAKIFPEGSPQQKIFSAIFNGSKKAVQKSKELFLKAKERTQKFIKEDSKVIIANTLEKLKTKIGSLGGELKQFMSLSWKLKILFVVAIVMAVVTFSIAKKSLEGQLIPGIKKTYIINFNEVADKIHKIDKNAEWEQFRNPMRFPEYVVRFDRLIVMLKTSKFSSNTPMGVFSIYFETSSQEAATEVKFREAEMRDVSARTLEGVSYDDIRNFEGKKKAKKALIQSVNKVLNQGKVVNVYFKDFVLKP